MKCHVSILDLDEYNITFQTLIHFAEPGSRHYWGREREARPKLGVACISDVQCFGGGHATPCISIERYRKAEWPPMVNLFILTQMWLYYMNMHHGSLASCLTNLNLHIWREGTIGLKVWKTQCGFPWDNSLTHHMARQCLCFMHVGLVSS